MIRLEHVTQRFGRALAVDNVSLDVATGESVALWGPNGAGKTTLLRCVLGLLRCAGRVIVGGQDVRRRPKDARMLVGYVPQELGFYDDLAVGEALAFFSRLKNLTPKPAAQVLRAVGLDGHQRKRIRELSGGMKQRLALSIALLGDPPILVLDEVTASLDALGRREFVSLLRTFAGEGRTMLFASHRIDEITTLAQRVVVLERGRIASEHPAAGFAERLGISAVLHVTIDPGRREAAISLLRDSGFQVRHNGVGLLIPVLRDQKAAPFRVLAEGRIPVSDFELISAGGASHAARAEEMP